MNVIGIGLESNQPTPQGILLHIKIWSIGLELESDQPTPIGNQLHAKIQNRS